MGGQLGRFPQFFFFISKSSNQNYEKAPQSPWEGLQVTNFDQCLHIVMYWEVYRRFQVFFCLGGEVEGRLLRGRIFPWRNLSWGKRICMNGDLLALLEK